MKEQLNIIVCGASGRMGQEICTLVMKEAAFKLAGVTETPPNLPEPGRWPCPVSSSLKDILKQAGDCVIIDFTSASSSLKNASAAAEYVKPIVIGSTGLDEDQKMELAALATTTPILWSANMSIGINVLCKILPALAAALGPDYDMELVELHHRNKKDAPSGTALMLGEILAKARDWKLEEVRVSERNGIIGPRKNREIGVQAVRGGDVPGIHNVYFLGAGEFIEVTHNAESRENFARGALRAAHWLADKPAGCLYSMTDVIWP